MNELFKEYDYKAELSNEEIFWFIKIFKNTKKKE